VKFTAKNKIDKENTMIFNERNREKRNRCANNQRKLRSVPQFDEVIRKGK
jgi:hypothetical protein